MNGIKVERAILSTVNSNIGTTALVGKKIGLLDHFTCLLIDEGTGAPVARSRNKAVVKATRIGSGYESLLVSNKSIVLAIENSDLKKLVHGHKVLVFPYPEWQGQPRLLVDFSSNGLTLGGDFVTLQNVDRGIFLKIDRERSAEQVEKAIGPVQEREKDISASVQNPAGERARETTAVAKPMQADMRQARGKSTLIPPLAPECLGQTRYLQLMADFPGDFPRKRDDETVQDYIVRVSAVLNLEPALQEAFPNISAWARQSTRFEVLRAARVTRYILKKKLASASSRDLAAQLNISSSVLSNFTTIYDKWRKAIEIPQDKHEDMKSDAWLDRDCGSIHAFVNTVKTPK